MTQQQFNWIYGLDEDETLIMQMIVIHTRFKEFSEIQTSASLYKKIPVSKIKEFVKVAIERGFLKSGYPDQDRYILQYSVPLYLLPYLMTWVNKKYIGEWKKLRKTYYGYRVYDFCVRDFLLSLLFNDPFLKSSEDSLFRYDNWEIIDLLSPIVEGESYSSCLKSLNKNHLYTLYRIRMTMLTNALLPHSRCREIVKSLTKNLNLNLEDDEYIYIIDVHKGKFREDAEDVFEAHFFLQALQNQLKGNSETALELYDQGIELVHEYDKNQNIPPELMFGGYFLMLLMALPVKERIKRFRKLTKNKSEERSALGFFSAALSCFVLNDTEDLSYYQESIKVYIKPIPDMETVFAFVMLYMTEYKPDKQLNQQLTEVLQLLITNEYYVLANELLVVAQHWCPGNQTDTLSTQLAEAIQFVPQLSYLITEEDWEKPLNLLLSIGGKGARNPAAAKAKEDKSRIVYVFDPVHKMITPMQQTRTAKGVWKEGKELSLRVFYGCKTAGMSEQDLRIAKTIKQYKSYYSAVSYDFSPQMLVELAGHPYIFLKNSMEVPVVVELSQPVVEVTKLRGGYTIKSDCTDTESTIQLVKETNTRYKVYKLTASQLAIIKVIASQKILIPEQGKSRLVHLLGELSRHTTVHSDLIASGDEEMKVIQVEPDLRIRIQLLPFMDGLKVELFSKPFGDRPPYCKPGAGGKVLVANDKKTQLQVQRNLEGERKNHNFLLEKIQQIETVEHTAGLFSFQNPLDALEVLELAASHADSCVLEWPEGVRFSLRSRVDFNQLQLRTRSKTNWFELDGEIKVDDNMVLTLQQLLSMNEQSTQRFVEVKPGEYIALSAELRKKLTELSGFVKKEKNNLQLNKFAAASMGDWMNGAGSFAADSVWTKFKERVKQASETEAVIPVTLQTELRSYQEEGFRWMMRLAEWEAGACLADDMGLGKTIQTLAVMLSRASKGPQIVVSPLSVLNNWRSEILRFAPTLQIKVMGISNRDQMVQSLGKGDVLLVTYGLLQTESELLSTIRFASAVLDEAHIIKNITTKTSKASMKLNADFRIALTGTPVQNHSGEIWNLFQFLNPGLLGTVQQFTSTFIKNEDEAVRKQLRKLIAPFILRRTKSAVLDELPAKTEIIRQVQFSDEEATYYEALRRKALATIENDDSNAGARQIRMLAEITRLRQACCNVQLIDPELKITSSKLTAFMEIVEELLENHHRALVFSQFVSHLSLVRKELDKQGTSYLYLDGSTPSAKREELVSEFQRGEASLFLISLKAGGLGLNLTAADYVVHLDPWWNPAIEDQATDRAHRIGQLRPVTVYRLVTSSTIEEKIIRLHQTKKDLADSLLEGSDLSARLSFNEMMELMQESKA